MKYRDSPFLIVGHRGCRNGVEENSLDAVQKGLDEGSDVIEIDVWQVEDQIVVFHDRLRGPGIPGEGLINDMPLHEIRRYLPAPSLMDVMLLVGPTRRLNIELKDPACSLLVLDTVRQFQKKTGAPSANFLFSSFDHQQLIRIKAEASEYPLGVLVEGVPWDLAAAVDAVGAQSFHPSIAHINTALVDDAHRRGSKVIPYTVNSSSDIAHALDLCVDGIFTDFPARTRQIVENLSTDKAADC